MTSALDQSPTGYPIFYRSYSRNVDGHRESWPEAIERQLQGLIELGSLTDAEIEMLRRHALAITSIPSGRWLWVGGTEWSKKPENFYGSYNCSSTNLNSWEAFGHMLNLGMQGCGTGAVLEDQYISQLPPITTRLDLAIQGTPGDVPQGERLENTTVVASEDVVTVIVGDSRQGWVDAYVWMLELASGTAQPIKVPQGDSINLIVDISHARPMGERLKGFGGVANPIKLPDMFRGVVSVLNKAVGRQLNSVECCLVIDHGAACFVAGNVRRSAGMRQFDESDELAATAKDNLWQQSEDGTWRIDPERDPLRMANHTRTFHHRPSLEEVTASVTKQFYSGEGAIQYVPEAIARANRDLLPTTKHKEQFIEAYVAGHGRAFFLDLVQDRMPEEELQYRLSIYGLNPCFPAGTLVATKDDQGNVVGKPIEELVGQSVTIYDGIQWTSVDTFRVTGHDQPVWELSTRMGSVIRCTANHEFPVVISPELENILDWAWDKRLHVEAIDWGQKKPAKELRHGDCILKCRHSDKSRLASLEPVSRCRDTGEIADKVYCCTVPTTNCFMLADGLMVGNCGEILLSDNFCNLAEVHLNQFDALDPDAIDEAFRAAAVNVSVLLHHKFPDERYQRSRELDPIVGVSFTGLFDFFVKALGVDWLRWWEAGRDIHWDDASEEGEERIEKLITLLNPSFEFKHHLNAGWLYLLVEQEFLSRWNKVVHNQVKKYCLRNGLKFPNRCTTTQPAGSKSLLTGASPGWHPPKAQRYIRRMTFAKNDPVALACIDYGYSVVPSQSDKDELGKLLDDPFDARCTEWLVEIPVEVPWANLPGCSDIAIEKFTATTQFDFYMQVQEHYTTHNCFARDTAFYTSQGIKTFNDFSVGDTVTVLNGNAEWTEATVVNTGDERPMLTIVVQEGKTGRRKEITSTYCHRFPVRRASGGKCEYRILEASELKVGQRLVGNFCDFIEPALDGIRHGIVFGDGSAYKNSKGEYHASQLYLCNGKRHLQSYFVDFERTYERDDLDQTRIYGLPLSWKSLPGPDCSQEYVAGFIAGLLATDGSIFKSTVSFSTSRKDVVEFLELHCPRVGIRITSSKAHSATSVWSVEDEYFVVTASKVTFPASLILRPHHMEHYLSHDSQPNQWRIIEIREANSQVGWCVMEPKTNQFTLADNILVMNTSATIEYRQEEIPALSQAIYDAINDNRGYISVALLARFDDLQTYPRLPFEPIDKPTYDKLMAEVFARRVTDDFHGALSRYDQGELFDAGPAGCDSDKCLLPLKQPG